jgi:hypothetical protein
VHPDGIFAVRRLVYRQSRARFLGIDLKCRQQGIGGAGPGGHQRKSGFWIALDAQVEQRRGSLHKTAHVSGQQPAIVFLLYLVVEMRQSPTHLAAFPKEHALSLRKSLDLLLCKVALQALGNAVGISSDRLLQIVPHRQPLKQPAYHVEYLIRLKLATDRFELVEQGLQHPTLARTASH